MRNDFLGINSDLEWVKPSNWAGRPQGDYIKTADSRFYVSKSMDRGVPMYTAWDKKKVESVYGPHTGIVLEDGRNSNCMLLSHDNGWLGRFHFLQEAVTICEMRLETMESVTA